MEPYKSVSCEHKFDQDHLDPDMCNGLWCLGRWPHQGGTARKRKQAQGKHERTKIVADACASLNCPSSWSATCETLNAVNREPCVGGVWNVMKGGQ